MRTVLVTAVLALACAFPVSASAHDSLAPPGAEHRWLPSEPWVQKHWMPFDESRLYELLGVDTRAVFKWLANDHRSLAQLARRRGVSPGTLGKRLMEPRRDSLSAREYRVLRSRTERVLTQGHLAQHVFFHVFHGSHLTEHANGAIRRLFGVNRHQYNRLRQRAGLSPYAIARRHGKPTAAVRKHVIAHLRAEAHHGVHAESGAE